MCSVLCRLAQPGPGAYLLRGPSREPKDEDGLSGWLNEPGAGLSPEDRRSPAPAYTAALWPDASQKRAASDSSMAANYVR